MTNTIHDRLLWLRDGSADEIAVTPAMRAAGREELERHYLGDGVYDVADGNIVKIYRLMRKREALGACGCR